jgi:DNA-binding NtrC family response regulator
LENKARLLLACSDPESRERVTELLRESEFRTVSAGTFQESSGVLARQGVSVVFCEERLPGGGFPKLLSEVKRSGVRIPVVVLSRTGEWEEYLAALRLGAFDMVTPPYDRTTIRAAAYKALHESRVARRAGIDKALPREAPPGAAGPAGLARHAAAGAVTGGMERASQEVRRPERRQTNLSLAGESNKGSQQSCGNSLSQDSRAANFVATEGG